MTAEGTGRRGLALALIVASTVLGLMGTDLVLPAVPSLPEALGGDAATAQLVLAAYVAGTAIGLLAFGSLGDRLGTRALLIGSLLLTGLVSLACAAASDIWTLVGLRALQGAVASGPAVFAPGLVKAMFDEAKAVRALGALGSIESLAPALAPILGAWLLLFRGHRLGKAGRRWVTGLTGLAVASHPSHLGLLAGLVIAAALLKWAARWRPVLPRADLKRGVIALAVSLGLIVAGNFVLTGKLFLSKSGSVFLFARLMQDGIVQRLMDDTCPPAGSENWRLCSFKNRLPKSANAWLWGERSGFRTLGGFTNERQQQEDRRIILETIRRYPVMHLRAAVTDSLVQFLQFKTGDGIEPQLSIQERPFRRVIPQQIPAYREARQQQGLIRFKTLNLIHVPTGAMSLLGLLLLLQRAVLRRAWDHVSLPVLVLLGLIGNAIICGTFSNPHDRYQSRLIWLPGLVLILARMKNPNVLQPAEDAR